MKVKELIKVLQALDQETLVNFQIGSDQEYRNMCAKAELVSGDAFDGFTVKVVEIYDNSEDDEDDGLLATIVLTHYRSGYLFNRAEHFDKIYKKQDDENK